MRGEHPSGESQLGRFGVGSGRESRIAAPPKLVILNERIQEGKESEQKSTI